LTFKLILFFKSIELRIYTNYNVPSYTISWQSQINETRIDDDNSINVYVLPNNSAFGRKQKNFWTIFKTVWNVSQEVIFMFVCACVSTLTSFRTLLWYVNDLNASFICVTTKIRCKHASYFFYWNGIRYFRRKINSSILILLPI